MKRPAETAGATGAVALLICRIAGIADPDALVAIGAAVGLLPAVVTLLVANGGVRGVAGKLWRGRGNEAGYAVIELAIAVVVLLILVFVLLRLAG